MASVTITATSFLLTLLSFAYFLSLPISTTASNVSAIFAFGDSTVDSGNNNRFHTIFKGDHLPYGRDLPQHLPTGRFSDGKIPTDYLANMLGLKDLLPAYLDPHLTEQDLLTGVSFASGGSGLDSQTVKMARVMGLSTQFELFEESLQRITTLVGEEKAGNIIENALFVISIGTNDMLYNAYLLPGRALRYGGISLYQDFLIQNLESFIQELYGAGARRILVTGLPPIGCLPLQVTLSSLLPGPHWLQRLCNVQQNTDSEAYNVKLQSRINSLQATLSGAKVGYFDIYTPMMDMIMSPTKYGFQQTLQGCCGTGLLELGPVCNLVDATCLDASKYLFWDAVHLTQAGYKFLADSGRQTVLPRLIS